MVKIDISGLTLFKEKERKEERRERRKWTGDPVSTRVTTTSSPLSSFLFELHFYKKILSFSDGQTQYVIFVHFLDRHFFSIK